MGFAGKPGAPVSEGHPNRKTDGYTHPCQYVCGVRPENFPLQADFLLIEG